MLKFQFVGLGQTMELLSSFTNNVEMYVQFVGLGQICTFKFFAKEEC